MGKFSDILLTADFDRTMTAPDSSIPERNLEAIRYFMENGGAFTLNTGRSLPMIINFMDRIPVNAPLLLYNGSAAYDWQKKEFLFQHPIDLDWRQMVSRCMELFPGFTVEIQGVDAHYSLGENPMWAAFSAQNRCTCTCVTTDDEIDPFLKVTIFGKITEFSVAHLFEGTPKQLAEMDEMQKILEQEFSDKTVVFRAGPRILDIHCKGVSKGRGARELQHMLGRKTLVCVGDGENDVTMLQEADYAFCPGDAIVKDRFTNVCNCADGAVADVIYKKIPEIL